MLYGFLLTFGFITMTPQLFINYKLKSVAHLPWRMLTYKALNTFIDDLFAFVIKMPVMYRIGCLRDDVVFFIYLYQRWIYRVDPTRVNEFGMSGEDPTAAAPVAEVPTAAGALTPTPAPTTTTATREEASTSLPTKPTQGASSATEPQEAPPKPAEDKKRISRDWSLPAPAPGDYYPCAPAPSPPCRPFPGQIRPGRREARPRPGPSV